MDAVDLFSTLGLVVHSDKSVLEPTQNLEFLGFLLNSILMRIPLTSHKVQQVHAPHFYIKAIGFLFVTSLGSLGLLHPVFLE